MKSEVQEKIAKINSIVESTMLKLNLILVNNVNKSLQQLGEDLVSLDSDKYTNGGFWLWNYKTNEVFYSPVFCNSLGFEYGELGTGLWGFDRADVQQMNQGMQKIKQLIEEKKSDTFFNIVCFPKKDNTIIKIECSGAVLFLNDEPYVILGTHKILDS